METLYENIPSDFESIDGLCDSEDEDVIISDVETRINHDVELSEESDVGMDSVDDSDNESNEILTVRLANSDGIWEKKSRSKDDTPFTTNSGPNIPDSAKTPLDIFLCLFPNELIELIVHQTNLYSAQIEKKPFNVVTKDEILKFLGLNIFMGVKKLPSYRDFWSRNELLHDTYVSNVMTVIRFGYLLSHFHLNDNSNEPKKGQPGFDKLYKIRPLLDKLSETFKTCYKPNQYQSIDESMIRFKGRSSFKQYMPMKPIKRGYKVWVRADESVFVCEFQIYVGKSDNNQLEKSLGSRVVKDLTRTIVGDNHRVFFDNFFTSTELMISLKTENIMACGTVRSNRVGLPKTQKKDKDMVRGEHEFRSSYKGLVWLKWKDNRVVSLLSNFHDPSVTIDVNRRMKDGSTKIISCPEMVKEYNKHMGYVDKADMLKSLYEVDRKSKKWWLRIVWHFVDVCVTNAFIIYKQSSSANNLSLKKFRLALVDGLIGGSVPTKKGRKRSSADCAQTCKPQVSLEKRHASAAHMPQMIEEKKSRRCTHCSTKINRRVTKWKCSTCNVPLCLLLDRNCFAEYHA
ncbi:piggyBac transposable element-derived protein 4-like [Mycetomoellerius zeteki]|uniref:piggyBac transposable element-derived protein 4-like n=1 Tax=Mycetomoellerius zeteki TaxID=64791 RepID=UPI00084E7995|nr:PREDICTED: piggyBac transposable element-derived protein 4-like [Trachymyrmex zeteki]